MRKEKPILFNTKMVRAILDGKKTQTRRPVKQDLICGLETDKNDPDYLYVEDRYGDSHHLLKHAPYQPGTILYVRETFMPCEHVFVDGEKQYLYRASLNDIDKAIFEKNNWKWKPSIHMPKEAARLFLKVTDVRVERLQEISIKDIKAEGVEPDYIAPIEDEKRIHLEIKFKEFWNKIYKNKGYCWKENPWVWVIEFNPQIKNERRDINE